MKLTHSYEGFGVSGDSPRKSSPSRLMLSGINLLPFRKELCLDGIERLPRIVFQMQLPDAKELGAGLRRWRDQRGMSADKVAKISGDRSKKSFQAAQVSKWESGSGNFTYKRLVEDILPAYGIEDFDLFVDFCQTASVSDVTVIRAEEFTRSPIATGAIDQYLDPGFLKSHRTRIDRVTFEPGRHKSTPWGTHDGHEFVLLLQGEVTCGKSPIFSTT